MLKKILLAVGIVLLIASGVVAYLFLTTKSHSPAATARFSGQRFHVSVDYCRPYKKGREIFGGLLPYSTYWRAGANEATEISFSEDVFFGGEKVNSGRYRLYVIPHAQKWVVALNSELGQWGYYEPNYHLDVLRIEAPVQKRSDILEQFTVSFATIEDGTNMVFEWDDTKVEVPITASIR